MTVLRKKRVSFVRASFDVDYQFVSWKDDSLDPEPAEEAGAANEEPFSCRSALRGVGLSVCAGGNHPQVILTDVSLPQYKTFKVYDQTQ